MAPVDIVISIIETAKNEALKGRDENAEDLNRGIIYYNGKIDQCKELIKQLEEFKKLFN